jgi:microcystin-dependent protein
MADPFYAEIRMFGFNYAPLDWAFCDGSQLQVVNNQALYALLGNLYGGTAMQTFNLPNLQSRVPQGVLNGTSPSFFGVQTGSESVTLAAGQIAPHDHPLNGQVPSATSQFAATPGPTVVPSSITSNLKSVKAFSSNATPDASFDANMLQPTGGGGAHENRQPYLAVSFCICTSGIFPPFS